MWCPAGGTDSNGELSTMLPMTTQRLRPGDPAPLATRDGRLDRMTTILDSNRMRIHLGGRDRTGIILYLSRLVYEHGLSIQESNVTRLQDQNGSIFLVTGPFDGLSRLSERIESDRDRTLDGEVISPFRVFDLIVNVPDRPGLMLDVCTILRDFKVNIKSMTSFVYVDADDVWWARIHTRVEVTRERMKDMPRMQRQLDQTLRSFYDETLRGSPGYFDFAGWNVTLRERPGTGFEDLQR